MSTRRAISIFEILGSVGKAAHLFKVMAICAMTPLTTCDAIKRHTMLSGFFGGLSAPSKTLLSLNADTISRNTAQSDIPTMR